MTDLTKKRFQSLSDNVGKFNLCGKTLLIPEMNRIGCHLFAGTLRGFNVNSLVLETYKGLDLGLEYSSGKECYPCQVTLGDALYFLKKEKSRLGNEFNLEDYLYFMPESNGPCRFGMYNKYQRIVFDSFPEFKELKIFTLTTGDGYSLEGIIDKNRMSDLRKASFFSVVVADIMDRLLWRLRPYEKEPGMADDLMERSIHTMSESFELYGHRRQFKKILEKLGEVIEQAKLVVDTKIPPKPLIGIVGEIYLRCHVQSNQNLIKLLERHGAEVVNASITEWINFITYKKLKEAKSNFRLNLKQLRPGNTWKNFKDITRFSGELFYQEIRQKTAYKYVEPLIDLPGDHRVSDLEETLEEEDTFDFYIGTEASLSISGIMEYARAGYNGVLNVYPFTCMPSTITSSILKPLMNRVGTPYLDTPYDASFQPGREASVRTFMYQAYQHMARHGRRSHWDDVD